MKDFYEWSSGSKTLSNKIALRAHGYKEDLNWYVHNKNMVNCIAKYSECCKYCFACTARQSLQTLLPGWFKTSILNRFSNTTILPDNYNKTPSFDIGIHLRNQLHHFEMNKNPDSLSSQALSFEFVKSKKVKNLFENILRRVEKTAIDNAKIYISSDNEVVKLRLTSLLESKGYKVYRTISDGIVHSKTSSVLSQLTLKKGIV